MIVVMNSPRPHRALSALTLLPLTTLLVAACGPTDPTSADHLTRAGGVTQTPAAADAGASEEATEQRGATPRLVATYDGGLLVLDATTLELVADLPLEGYNRLAPAGDDRHVAVSTSGGFRLVDTGTWAEPHGDHTHHYTSRPDLTEVRVEAVTPGHVVVNEGRTTFFDDGTGEITVVDSRDVADVAADRRRVPSVDAHHGVAVVGDDDEVISTLGDPDSRIGVVVRDASGREIARNEECPGVHGEAAAMGALVFGCTDGVVVYSGGRFTKIDSPDTYGRIGNQAGSPASPVVLGDYKVDRDAELERPERISLIDTRGHALRLVELPSSYSFRSLGRGPEGEVLVLGTDGRLHVVDPVSGQLVRSIEVVDPWTEPMDWQDPRPTLFVQGDVAYVTEPSTSRLMAVDIASGQIRAEAALPRALDELTGVGGSESDAGE